MPLERYDKFFGGKRGAAAETLAKMKKTYGPKEGQTVFDATVTKRKRKATTRPRFGKR